MAAKEFARVAKRKSTESQLKEFAKMSFANHASAVDKIRELAKNKGFCLPHKLGNDDQRTKKELLIRLGRAFDEHMPA